MGPLLTLLKTFGNLCLLRANPQDLPAAPVLTVVTLLAYTLVSVGLSLPDLGLGRAALWAVLDTGVLAILTHSALLLRRFPERFYQTLAALMGSGALLGLLAWPIVAMQNVTAQIVMLVWNLAVVAHILRHALSVPLALGILASLGYFMAELLLSLAFMVPAAN
ncbi:MAG: hypothetical protein Q8L89_01595 [Gammaproteobacteria bacterium]|nr:hypothetical protein [Gammaproteobacteria bacterium]